MRRLYVFLILMLTSCSLVLPASASRLSEARSVSWWGGAVFLDESTCELISLETDEVLLTGVVCLSSDGECLWAGTPEAWYRIAEDNTLTEAGYRPETVDDETLRYGFVIAGSRSATTVHRLSDGAELLRRDGYADIQVCRDEMTGQDYILSGQGDILRADGTRVVPEGTLSELVRDCHFSFVHDGYAFGYPEPFNEADPKAVVIDLSTGETVAVFDGRWCDYVGWGMIYDDGTAVLGAPEDPYTPAVIVRCTTGDVLLKTPFEIGLRHADESCYILHATDDTDYSFDPDKIITADGGEKIRFLDKVDQSEDTAAAPALEYLKDEDGHFAGKRVLDTDGQPISEEIWQDVIPYDVHDVDLESAWPQIFNPDGGAEVVGPDGGHGILGRDGRMIIPAVCETIEYRPGQGYLVRITDTWEILDLAGNQLY